LMMVLERQVTDQNGANIRGVLRRGIEQFAPRALLRTMAISRLHGTHHFVPKSRYSGDQNVRKAEQRGAYQTAGRDESDASRQSEAPRSHSVCAKLETCSEITPDSRWQTG